MTTQALTNLAKKKLRVRVTNVISGEVATNILKSDVRDDRKLPEGKHTNPSPTEAVLR